MKKILALVLTLTLVLVTCAAAFAAEGDTTLTVTGLSGATSVKYYKVLDWNDTNGWVWAAPYSSDSTHFTDAVLKEITGTPASGSTAAVPGKITQDTANLIAGTANSNVLTGGTLDTNAGTWSVTVNGLAARGLYMVVPTGSGNTLFNPIFVAANHGATTQSVGTDSGYADGAMAKRSDLTVDKKTDKHTFQGFTGLEYAADSVQPGDTIKFWVETTIPKFADSYTNPVFTVNDTVSAGMNITTTSLKVYKGTKAELGDALTAGTDANSGDYHTTYTTASEVTSGFAVSFHKTYFDSMVANQNIVVYYEAVVTNAAPKTVNEENNTVRIDFTNGPDNSTGHIHDKTRHWTFSLDAELLGNSQYETTELVKVELNPDGSIKTATTTYHNETGAAPLAGATFQLKKGDTVIRQYTTQEDGKIHFEGLDVGEYTLIETQAPAGYIKDNGEYKVDISAEVIEDAYEETLSDGCKIMVDKLDSYKVTVTDPDGNKVESSYTFDAGTTKQSEKTDHTTQIGNVPGAVLPSTGGIGTTIFYILGGLLVVGAVVILVARRKAQD